MYVAMTLQVEISASIKTSSMHMKILAFSSRAQLEVIVGAVLLSVVVRIIMHVPSKCALMALMHYTTVNIKSETWGSDLLRCTDAGRVRPKY